MKLNIPEQVVTFAEDLPTTPRKVKKWLEGLKQANMGDYTRLMYSTLLKLNRSPIPPDDRFEVMELLRQPVRHIFNQLHKQFVNRTLPLPEKSLKIVNLNQTLLNEMATGYKILIYEASNDISKVDSKDLLIACERTLHYLSELLLRCSQIYTEQPKDTWWDIHHIYAFAELRRLQHKSIKDSEIKSGSVTIEEQYKQMMLFSLAKPNAMRQSDSERVYKSMQGWAQRTAISTKPIANLNRHYCSQIDSDMPPSCIANEDLPDTDNIRIISTAALVNFLRGQVEESDVLSNGVAFGDLVPQETLRALITAWSTCTKRRFSRAASENDSKIAIGLNPIYEAIIADTTTTPTKSKIKKPASMFSLESIPDSARVNRDTNVKQDPNQFITHPELSGQHDKPATNWDLVGRGHALTETYANEIKNKNITDSNKESPDLHWRVSNISAGGYCLEWRSENPSRALVGELIGIREREPDSTYQWRIGVIRWMQYSTQTGLEIGVQILALKVISCTVRRRERKDEQPFKCLMLPGIKPIQQPSTLLMPAHAFRKDNELKLHVYERDMEINLGTIREHTGSFTQFQFSQKEDDAPKGGGNPGGGTTNSAGPKSSNHDDFDSIWSSL